MWNEDDYEIEKQVTLNGTLIYSATIDGDPCCGYGKTKQEAISDYIKYNLRSGFC